MEVSFIGATTNAEEIIKLAISQCYQQPASTTVLRHCISAGHLSVLEHAMATFKISVSLQTLLQLTRHRHLSFTCQSTRGSLIDEVETTGVEVVDETNSATLQIYRALVQSGNASLEEAALMLPKAMTYNLVVSGNFRVWYEYLPKRMCKRAQTEHRALAESIQYELMIRYPNIFKGVKAPCDKCKEKGCEFHNGK